MVQGREEGIKRVETLPVLAMVSMETGGVGVASLRLLHTPVDRLVTRSYLLHSPYLHRGLFG